MSSRPVKTRFCPSPTGTPHVGLIRTALYNWAYARRHNGTFLFRIEDTDSARDSEDSFNAIIDALTWLGITTDEGVIAGGSNGPYRQSERSHIYTEILNKLKDSGYVYESYSNADDITARNLVNGRNRELGYDNYDRNLTDAEIADFKAAGRKAVLRLRVPDEDIKFVDLIRGEVVFPAGSFSDFVVARDNGAPLYTLVNPVDDALMGVTHVIRGEDLLSSTPRQIALYRALIAIGVTDFIPEFGHLPLILGDDGKKKMSKRDPNSNLFDLRDKGFIPEGLLNYLALLGWAISGDRDVFTLEEMFETFDIHKVSSNPAKFDEKKAVAINAEHIRMLTDEEIVKRVIPVLTEAGDVFANGDPTVAEFEVVELLAPVLRTRLRTLNEAVDYVRPILDGNYVTSERTYTDADRENLQFAYDLLTTVDENEFTAEKLSFEFGAAIDSHEVVTNKTLWGVMRLVLVNSRISLPLFEVMEVLGKTETLRRIEGVL